MNSRRSLLVGLGTAALAGCLGGDSGSRSETTASGVRSRSTPRPPETCRRVTAPAAPYELAVVVTDAPTVPVDLTVTVSGLGETVIETPTPVTAVPDPEEPDGGPSTAAPYLTPAFRERFVIEDRYEPRTRTDVFVGDDEFTVTVDGGDSGVGWYWVRDTTDGPTTVTVAVGADGVRASESTTPWETASTCRR